MPKTSEFRVSRVFAPCYRSEQAVLRALEVYLKRYLIVASRGEYEQNNGALKVEHYNVHMNYHRGKPTMKFASAIVLAGFALTATRSQAQTFVETQDTGNDIATAIVLPAGTTQVEGSLNSDHDLWGFNVSSSQSVQILLGLSPFDDNLILFDSLGRGIAGNDDIGRGSASPGINLPAGIGGLDSEIVAFLDPGLYYIGVGRNNSSGIGSNGISFIDNDSGLLASPTIDVLDFVGGSQGTGGYTLFFSPPTAASVPEPTSFSLIGCGLLGTVGLRRRRL